MLKKLKDAVFWYFSEERIQKEIDKDRASFPVINIDNEEDREKIKKLIQDTFPKG